MLTLDKIYHAKFILKQVARKTDLIAAPRLCPGTDLYLKTENLQVTGSFKVRGAYYKISQLSAEERAKGVIACSAGNHAQGVALAATRMGIKSVVCMPDGAPIMKVESTKRLGAEVELVKGTYDDAHDRAVELQEQTGMTFIHPYDDELVIAGQGTIGLEILDQLPDVDAVIVPIGGGGLISGVAFAIKSLRPEVKIYGVQAEGAHSMYRSLHEHKYQTLKNVATFADGIQVKTPGELTYQLCEEYVDDIVTVSEDETAAAILSLMENQKLVAEGAGAVPVAAVLALLFAAYLAAKVSKQDAGTDRLKEIAGAIAEGARAFLTAEYKILVIFVAVLFVLIGIGVGSWVTAICFVVGALFSTIAGYCGMTVATKANVRTANAAKEGGMNKALSIAFSGGAVMGMCVAGLGALCA